MSHTITVLFIHGTGTREVGFRGAISEIHNQLHKILPQVRAEGFYWGGTLGTDLHFDGVSVPGYNTTRGVIVESLTAEVDSSAALIESELRTMVWEQLDRDPLFEFRQLSAAAATGPLPPGAASQDSALLETLDRPLGSTTPGQEFMDLLAESGLYPQFDAAVAALREADELRLVLADDHPYHLPTLARAIIATMLFLPGATDASDAALDAMAMDPIQRDLWAGLLAEHLHGLSHPSETRGVTDFAKHAFEHLVKAPFLWSAAHAATWRARRRRRSLTDGTSAAVGDILWYQAHGRQLREEIARHVDLYAQEGPVVLLGHSLGGIACVETLIEQAPQGVKLLITVGSQAPYFYEIGALATKPLPPAPRTALPHALPPTFPRWLNFHDPRDFLSYVAGPILSTPGVGVEPIDFVLDNGHSFPASHSAYWRNADLWKIAQPFIEGL